MIDRPSLNLFRAHDQSIKGRQQHKKGSYELSRFNLLEDQKTDDVLNITVQVSRAEFMNLHLVFNMVC